jgi:4-hydroxybenzoate polyprenyltransferase
MNTGAISFRASDVDYDKLKGVLSCHFAYERARAFRSAVVVHMTMIVLIVWALSRGIDLLPANVLGVTCLVASAAIAFVVGYELRARARLLQEMSNLPGA